MRRLRSPTTDAAPTTGGLLQLIPARNRSFVMPTAKQNPSLRPSDAAEQLTLAALEDEALALLYDQVRAIAGKFRRSGFRADSLATTDLANETLLKVFSKLVDKPFESQQHLVNTIAKVMYHLLCERFRRRKTRRELAVITQLKHEPHDDETDRDWLLDFTEQLEVLEERRARAAEVARLRVYFSMTVQEIADTLECSRAAAQREFAFARAFFKRRGYTDEQTGLLS